MLRDVSEIERAPRRALAPRDDGRHAGPYDDDYDEDEYTEDEPRTDWSAQLAAMKRHQVTLGCLALIIVTLIWKIAFVGRYYFRQDDFEIMDLARQSSLSWSYLTHGYVGHFFPGVFAVAWVLSRDALYNWAAGEGVVVIMIAASAISNRVRSSVRWSTSDIVASGLARLRLFRGLSRLTRRVEALKPLMLFGPVTLAIATVQPG